jgi:2-C-methyl-D-erythritol 2,4-cyclodiphosphate synthase
MTNQRVGLGFDSHRLVPGPALLLGGIRIDHDLGLSGHSDGDVLTHALIDALLGATGLGDIGQHYPDTDDRFKDANSMDLLADTYGKVGALSLRLGNADATIIAGAPRLGFYRDAIRESLSTVLHSEPERVNIKFKTPEALGPLESAPFIAAQVIVSLQLI